MKVKYSPAAALAIAILAVSPVFTQELDWDEIYQESGFDAEPAAIIETKGGIYVTGRTKNAAGDYDYLTVKYDARGDERWSRTYDAGNDDEALAMALFEDDLRVTGKSDSGVTGDDFVTIRYDAAEGAEEARFRYDGVGYDDVPVGIATDGQGSVHVSGRSAESTGGPNDYLTIGYTADAETGDPPYWENAWGAGAGLNAEPVAIGVHDDGGQVFVVVTGRSQVAGSPPHYDYVTLLYVDPDDNTEGPTDAISFDNGNDDEPKAMAIWDEEGSDGQGSVHVTGRSGNNSAGNPGDILTVKYAIGMAGFEQVWQVTEDHFRGGSYDDVPTGVEVDGQGTVHVSGKGQEQDEGPYVAYLLMMNAETGELEDSTGCPSGFDGVLSEPVALAVDPVDGVYMAVKWRTDTLSGWSFMTAKYKVHGDSYNLVWFDVLDTLQYAFSAEDEPVGMALDVSGNIYVTGRSRDTVGTAWKMVTVKYALGSQWYEMAAMPSLPSTRPVKRGGWLVYRPDDLQVFAAKGYRTNDFYAYRLWTDEWVTLTGMPYATHPHWGSRPPGKGSRGVTDGDNSIYVTQGNNSLGFWRYLVAEDSWEILPDVPYGNSGKRVRGGTDMVYVVMGDTGYVYLLKGYGTDFLRYNTVSAAWQQLSPAPAGSSPKWRNGSWLVGEDEPTDYLFAHKARLHELWMYELASDSWFARTGMPLIGLGGRRKKSKDGGSAAWYSDHILALKGGNTQEFWKYKVADDTWVELDTMPRYGSSGRRKRVKQGADIVSLNTGVFYALKGNRTLEFWRYYSRSTEPWPLVDARPAGDAGVEPGAGFRLELAPNPIGSGVMTLHYVVPAGEAVTVKVFDVTGRSIQRHELGLRPAGATAFDLRGLSAGVYLVRLESGEGSAVRKVVVRR